MWKRFPLEGLQRGADALTTPPTIGGYSCGRLGHASGEGRMASAGAAARRYARMFHARVLSITVAPSARPARRSAAAGKRAAARRLSHWLGRRRRAR
jgi:hypothetical protein